MKKVDITNEIFDGYINGISRRAVLNELLSNRYPLANKWNIYWSKFKIGVVAVIIGLCLFLSGYTIGKMVAWDVGYECALRAIYNGDAKQVEMNKNKLLKKYEQR